MELLEDMLKEDISFRGKVHVQKDFQLVLGKRNATLVDCLKEERDEFHTDIGVNNFIFKIKKILQSNLIEIGRVERVVKGKLITFDFIPF